MALAQIISQRATAGAKHPLIRKTVLLGAAQFPIHLPRAQVDRDATVVRLLLKTGHQGLCSRARRSPCPRPQAAHVAAIPASSTD